MEIYVGPCTWGKCQGVHMGEMSGRAQGRNVRAYTYKRYQSVHMGRFSQDGNLAFFVSLF